MIVLIVNWYRMANTTVDSTIPWAGNPRLLNMSLQANKQETFSVFPVVLGREVSSLVRGTLWTSKQAAFKSLPWHSVMTICDPELQAKMNLSPALVRVYFHSDGKETRLGLSSWFSIWLWITCPVTDWQRFSIQIHIDQQIPQRIVQVERQLLWKLIPTKSGKTSHDKWIACLEKWGG